MPASMPLSCSLPAAVAGTPGPGDILRGQLSAADEGARAGHAAGDPGSAGTCGGGPGESGDTRRGTQGEQGHAAGGAVERDFSRMESTVPISLCGRGLNELMKTALHARAHAHTHTPCLSPHPSQSGVLCSPCPGLESSDPGDSSRPTPHTCPLSEQPHPHQAPGGEAEPGPSPRSLSEVHRAPLLPALGTGVLRGAAAEIN